MGFDPETYYAVATARPLRTMMIFEVSQFVQQSLDTVMKDNTFVNYGAPVFDLLTLNVSSATECRLHGRLEPQEKNNH